jgi:hypothetical protein
VTATVTAPVTATVTAPVTATVTAPVTPALSFRAMSYGGFDVGSLPGVAPGLGAAFAVHAGPQRFEIGVGIWPGRAVALEDRRGGLRANLVAGTAGACRSLVARPIELAPCAAVEIGRVHGESFGVTSPGEATALWIAARGGGALFWAPIDGAGLALRLDAVVPLVAPRLVLGGVGAVHEPSPVAARGSLGVELRF